MSADYEYITPDVANHVLHFYGHGGYEAGSFIVALLGAISRADNGNRLRLSLGFKAYVAAVGMIERTPTGVDRLREMADPAVAS